MESISQYQRLLLQMNFSEKSNNFSRACSRSSLFDVGNAMVASLSESIWLQDYKI